LKSEACLKCEMYVKDIHECENANTIGKLLV